MQPMWQQAEKLKSMSRMYYYRITGIKWGIHRGFFRGVCIGVMLGSALCFASLRESIPSTDKPINDYADILSAQTERNLDRFSRSLYARTGVSIVFVSLKSLGDEEPSEVANILYEKWGIGDSTSDEGFLVLITKKEREFWIEVGYGAEGYVPDAVAARIYRTVRDTYLAHDRFDDGVTQAFILLGRNAAAHHETTLDEIVSAPQRSRGVPRRQPMNIFQIIIGAIVLLVLVSTPFGRSLLFWLVVSSILSGGGRYRSGGFGGGFGNGGFGGFGGFGGGRSGGGGAGGSF
jgi:uncharacterized protein